MFLRTANSDKQVGARYVMSPACYRLSGQVPSDLLGVNCFYFGFTVLCNIRVSSEDVFGPRLSKTVLMQIAEFPSSQFHDVYKISRFTN